MRLNHHYRTEKKSKELQQYADEKIGKSLRRFQADEAHAAVTYDNVHGIHMVGCFVNDGKGRIFQVSRGSDSAFASIDDVAHRLRELLRKTKDKRIGSRRRMLSKRDLRELQEAPVAAEVPDWWDDWDDAAGWGDLGVPEPWLREGGRS